MSNLKNLISIFFKKYFNKLIAIFYAFNVALLIIKLIVKSINLMSKQKYGKQNPNKANKKRKSYI